MLIYSVFDKNNKINNMILKTEQTAVVHALRGRWLLHDVIKHYMVTTSVAIKIALKAMRNQLY